MSLAFAVAAPCADSMSSSFACEDSRSSSSHEFDWSLRVAAEVVTGARDRRVTGLEMPVAGAVVLAAADAAACERRVIGAILKRDSETRNS
jgi:hypothetical protein